MVREVSDVDRQAVPRYPRATALLAGYPDVMADAVLRRLFLILLSAGSANGMALAYTAVWASQTFEIGPQAVAMLFVVSGLAGAIGNPLIGLLSDRIGRRRPFVVGQLAISSSVLCLYPFVTSYTAGMALVAFSGFGVMGLTLTTVNDVMRSRADLTGARGLRVLATERSAWGMGIIVGPAVAAFIVTAFNDVRIVFPVAAVLQVGAALLALAVHEPGRHSGTAHLTDAHDRWPRRRVVALGALVLGLIFLALPSQARNMYLPLFITQILGEPAGAVGPAFTLNALVAVVVMPHMGTLVSRLGAQRVLYLAVVTGVAFCLIQARATTYAGTLANQVLIGLTITLATTGSLIYLQQLLPGRGGVAGGLYLAQQQLAPVVSGVVLGSVAESHGVPNAFNATALFVIAAAAILIPAHRAVTARAPAAGLIARVAR